MERWTVTVPPVAEAELLPERPVMWNGKEYWKIVASESRVIENP